MNIVWTSSLSQNSKVYYLSQLKRNNETNKRPNLRLDPLFKAPKMLPGDELQDVITEPKFSDNVTVTAAPTLTSFSSSIWSSQENKMFEVELAYNPRETVNRWEKIAAKLPGRSVQEVIEHYEELTLDLAAIEAGAVQFPACQDVDDVNDDDDDYDGGGGVNVNEVNQGFREPLASGLMSMNCSNPSSSRTKVENKKQRANPWSEEEHK